MALVIEDGTIVTGANSYIDDTDYIAYALARGVVIDPADAEQQLIQAMDYIETRWYQGQQVDFEDQELAWPRDYVYIEGNLLDNEVIPRRLINAQCELGMAYNSSNDPLGTITNANQIKEESFAVFKTVYMDGANDSPILQKVNAWLDPLLESGGGGLHFTVERSYG